jgi:hypothetical protein
MGDYDESAAQEQPTRCWLAAGSTLAAGNFKPSLAVDVGKDAIWLMDASTNALVASAWLSEVTATAATRLGNYFERQYAPRGVPILIVCIPSAQRLTIGCVEPAKGFSLFKNAYRFSWRGTVAQEKAAPAYYATGADWLTLVEKFDLAPYLEDRGIRP